MSAYRFMESLNNAIPENIEWEKLPLPLAIFAIEGLRHAIKLTEVYYLLISAGHERSPDVENQLKLHWDSTAISAGHISKQLMRHCKENRAMLLRTEEWLDDIKHGFEADFKSPYKKLGKLLSKAKRQKAP